MWGLPDDLLWMSEMQQVLNRSKYRRVEHNFRDLWHIESSQVSTASRRPLKMELILWYLRFRFPRTLNDYRPIFSLFMSPAISFPILLCRDACYLCARSLVSSEGADFVEDWTTVIFDLPNSPHICRLWDLDNNWWRSCRLLLFLLFWGHERLPPASIFIQLQLIAGRLMGHFVVFYGLTQFVKQTFVMF